MAERKPSSPFSPIVLIDDGPRHLPPIHIPPASEDDYVFAWMFVARALWIRMREHPAKIPADASGCAQLTAWARETMRELENLGLVEAELWEPEVVLGPDSDRLALLVLRPTNAMAYDLRRRASKKWGLVEGADEPLSRLLREAHGG